MHPIGVAAELSGVSIEAIRYYERDGVVPEAERSQNGRRTYDEPANARLRFVKRCRDFGFSIKQIKSLIQLSENKDTSCAEASEIGQKHLRDVQEKLNNLKQLESALAELLRNCADGQPDCPMLTHLFDDH